MVVAIILNVVIYIYVRCRYSSKCQRNDDGFWNFDNGNTGFCEYCEAIGDSYEDAGFIAQRGEQECKNICEGLFLIDNANLSGYWETIFLFF